MTDDKGKEEGQLRKKCPLLNDWCIGNACALSVALHRNINGVNQTTPACVFHGIITMLSEINQKTQPTPQKMQPIQLPHLRGG